MQLVHLGKNNFDQNQCRVYLGNFFCQNQCQVHIGWCFPESKDIINNSKAKFLFVTGLVESSCTLLAFCKPFFLQLATRFPANDTFGITIRKKSWQHGSKFEYRKTEPVSVYFSKVGCSFLGWHDVFYI